MNLYHELAEYYFALESNHRDIHHDVSFITVLLGAKVRPALLDLGCGSGEHLHLLREAGIKCTGIDSSRDMLAVARKRFPHGIEFIHADMAAIDYYSEFDMVICLFGTFDYLIHDAGIESLLLKIHKALKPDGLGVLEIWNTHPIRKIKKKEMDRISATRYGDATIKRERGFNLWNQGAGTIVEVVYRYVIDEGGETRTVSDRHIMRAFTKNEIMQFLEKAGFTVKRIFSSFLSDPYDENSSRMVIVFAR